MKPKTQPLRRTSKPLRVTSMRLSTARDRDSESWMELGFEAQSAAPQGHADWSLADGTMVMSESLARKTMPAAAIKEMRLRPCFYVAVDNLPDALSRCAGSVLGHAVEGLGMRNICLATPNGMMVLGERLA